MDKTENLSGIEEIMIETLDYWVDQLVFPILPPREIKDDSGDVRLELREHQPQTVMIGKCVRAVSGIYAAQALANQGFVTECASLLRMISEFCLEIMAIGEALNSSGELPADVQKFVNQYFTPKARNATEFANGKTKPIQRKELMKVTKNIAKRIEVDEKLWNDTHKYLNMIFDGYVHGYYETTMELYDITEGRFMMRGVHSTDQKQEFTDVIYSKAPEVIAAINMTAACTAHKELFEATKEALRTLSIINLQV